MIHFTVLKSAADAKKYYHPDYFIEDHQTVAFFGGKLADRLGLQDFDLQAFHDLCDGIHPGSRTPDNPDGTQLTPGKKGDKRAGFDVTVDGPKDLGVLMAMGLDDRIIPEVLERAGKEVMAIIERDAKTRVRIGKQDTDRDTGEIAYTGILHTTSRPVGDKIDIQPHYHFVVANATYDPVEKRMKALQLQPWALNGAKDARPYYTAYFNAQLARYMQGLGYDIEKTKDSFRVTGIPERVRKEFSQRTSKIEAVAAKLEQRKQEYLNDPQAKLNPAVKGRLGAHTREAKQPGKTWDSLVEHWTNRVSDTELQKIRDTVDKATPRQPDLSQNREAVDWSLRHLLERNSTVSQRELITTALKHGLGHVTPEGILHEVATRKDLIRRELSGVELVTTQAVLDEEKRIVEFAEKGRGRYRPLGNRKASATLLPLQFQDTALSPTQTAAVRHAWQSRDRLVLIRGAAGTGKTTLTKALLAGVDVPYVVLAPSAEASRGVLRREGVDPNADTLAKFLIDADMQNRVRQGLIVLDEASLCGAHDLARLTELADQFNARLLLLGDRRQHKSVARGDVLALLEDKAGIKVATVGEIRRQSGEYKKAVSLASDGKTADAFERLDQLGWIKEGHDALVEDYMAGLKAGKSQLVIAPTHAEGDTVTQKLRECLKQEGIVHGEEHRFKRLENAQLTEAEKSDPETLRAYAGQTAQFVRHGKKARAGQRITITEQNAEEGLAKEGSRFVVYQPREIDLAVGDTIRFTANGKAGEHRFNNGALYQVDGFDSNGNIRLSNGWVVDRGFAHLQHGYVSTSHASQGRTVDRVLIAQGSQSFPASDKSQFYVSISRGRQQASIYTDDREALREAINRDRPRVLATELVRKPRKKLRERMKRHISFLRRVLVRAPERVPERQREMGMER